MDVSAPSLSKKDIADLRFGLENGVDIVALSFVRKRDDVLRLRVYLEEADSHVFVVSKIEKPEAWENLDAIIDESDGVMVARGDLGVEMALESVPFVQKQIIERARKAGKFVITATQMLESMVHSPVPTRAEVSDVANAIYDGTDAVMLSAETSKGEYPVETVAIMARIAQQSDESLKHAGFKETPRRDGRQKRMPRQWQRWRIVVRVCRVRLQLWCLRRVVQAPVSSRGTARRFRSTRSHRAPSSRESFR